MKFLFPILSLTALVASAGAARGADYVPVTDVRGVYVPVGFDDNDEVTVVVDGYLPDPCHKLRRPKVEMNGSKVSVTAQAEVVAGVCTDMIVPFTQTVRLGTLRAGTYEVRATGNQQSESLPVTVATRPGPDEFLYAAVDSVHLTADKHGAYLRGRFTDSCQSIDSVKVIPTGKTIQVLPIMKVAAGPCEKKEREFEQPIALPEMAHGRYLLHVRSLNGQALNQLFTVGN